MESEFNHSSICLVYIMCISFPGSSKGTVTLVINARSHMAVKNVLIGLNYTTFKSNISHNLKTIDF